MGYCGNDDVWLPRPEKEWFLNKDQIQALPGNYGIK